MARTVDPLAHAVRREAFLDAAQRLIMTRGYAQLSIREVIAEVGASKGAFYHYFDSKAALLDGIVSRMVDTVATSLQPLVADPDRPAAAKLRGVFSGIASYKTERRELMLELMTVWLSDDNAVVRQKFRRGVITRMVPLLAAIIAQGAQEGAFSTDSPEHSARVFAALITSANEAASELYSGYLQGTVTIEQARRTLGAFGTAFERVIGARPGALDVSAQLTTLEEWFDAGVARREGAHTA